MRVHLKFPGQRASDTRIAVTLDEPALAPRSVTVYFIRVVDDEVDAAALINVGFEIGERFDRRTEPSEERIELERLPRPLDRATVELVAERFSSYVDYARAALSHSIGQRTPLATPAGSSRKRRELTDDFLNIIASQYRQWSAGRGRAVSEIALAHGVNPSTASRWVDAARERNLLEPKAHRG